jgi:hypothetical protein
MDKTKPKKNGDTKIMTSIKNIFLSPRDFLKMNLIIMNGNGPSVADIYNFRAVNLTVELGDTCVRSSKFFWKSSYAITVWGIWPPGGSLPFSQYETLPAFWLPYSPNTVHRAQVDSMAPFVLTASMTGCTFGTVTYKNGTTEICHANYQDDESGQLDKGRMARETAFCKRTLTDTMYRERSRGKAIRDINKQAAMGATVVGVKASKAWKFYAQQWECQDGSNYRYHKLLDV